MAGIASIGAAAVGAGAGTGAFVVVVPVLPHGRPWRARAVFDKAISLSAVHDSACVIQVLTEPEA